MDNVKSRLFGTLSFTFFMCSLAFLLSRFIFVPPSPPIPTQMRIDQSVLSTAMTIGQEFSVGISLLSEDGIAVPERVVELIVEPSESALVSSPFGRKVWNQTILAAAGSCCFGNAASLLFCSEPEFAGKHLRRVKVSACSNAF